MLFLLHWRWHLGVCTVSCFRLIKPQDCFETFDFSLIKPCLSAKKCSWSTSDPKVTELLKLDVVSGETWQRILLWFLSPTPLRWMFVSGRVSPLVEFHTNHSVTSEHGRPWRTAKARAFDMSNLFLRWESRWSLKRLFIMQSAECGGCLQLSASLYCWRRPHREERRKAEGVWTAEWYPEPLFTLDDNTLK